MTPARLRLGALLWLLTLQFFVVETVVAARYEGYSRIDDTISLLGSPSVSGAATLMNVSFVVQGLLVLGGLVLLRPALLGRGAQAATAGLAAAAGGVVIVGLLPLGEDDTWHGFGAALYLLGSAVGLVGLAYAVRPRSEAVGTVLALLGLLSAATTVFYLAAVTGSLGEGGTERAAAYPLPIGLALAGGALLRLADRPLRTSPADGDDAPAGRRALREQARAERARQARERDAALEAAAARTATEQRGTAAGGPAAQTRDDGTGDGGTGDGGTGDGGTGDGGTGDEGTGEDDFDPDDPWATPRRRGA